MSHMTYEAYASQDYPIWMELLKVTESTGLPL